MRAQPLSAAEHRLEDAVDRLGEIRTHHQNLNDAITTKAWFEEANDGMD